VPHRWPQANCVPQVCMTSSYVPTIFPKSPRSIEPADMFDLSCVVFSVCEAAGTSMKSSLFHIWTCDSLDHAIFCTCGLCMQFRQELAGLGGDSVFYKAEGGLQALRILLPGVVSSNPPLLADFNLTRMTAAPFSRRACRTQAPSRR